MTGKLDRRVEKKARKHPIDASNHVLSQKEVFEEWYYAIFNYLRNKRFLLLLVLFFSLVCFVLWNWERIEKIPAVPTIEAEIREWCCSGPPATGRKFSIVIAKLENDPDDAHRRLVREALTPDQSIEVLMIIDTIAVDGNARPQAAERAGHGRARELLKKYAADVLVWGSALDASVESPLLLHWTSSLDSGLPIDSLRYVPSRNDYDLPELSRRDLPVVIRLVAVAQYQTIAKHQDDHWDQQIESFIDRMRSLIADGKWSREQGALFRGILADTLVDYGEHRRDNQPIIDAIGLYRDALKDFTQEREPRAWATTQANLGSTLSMLGQREGDASQFEEAISAYREALKEFTREREPRDWATIQDNLGVALANLGKRETGTDRLMEAIGAHLEALKERPRELEPHKWAKTQNNLGSTLIVVGEREAGTAHLTEAAGAFREALKVMTRERQPFDWAGAKYNLGLALTLLGKRRGSTSDVMEGIGAYREALKEWTREREPHQWAKTKYELGNALTMQFQLDGVTVHLEDAIEAYREALKEQSHERAPQEWAFTQAKLGSALRMLGEREANIAHQEAATSAYLEALKRNNGRALREWGLTQTQLDDELSKRGLREVGTNHVKEAIVAFREVTRVFTRERAPLKWAGGQNNLGNAIRLLGEIEGDASLLEEATNVLSTTLAFLKATAPSDPTRKDIEANLALAQKALVEKMQQK
jgi:tetratricopeptide (TPR) repeat protein